MRRSPTLAQMLAEAAGLVPLLIEINDPCAGLGPDVGKLPARGRGAGWLRRSRHVLQPACHRVAFHKAAPDIAVG